MCICAQEDLSLHAQWKQHLSAFASRLDLVDPLLPSRDAPAQRQILAQAEVVVVLESVDLIVTAAALLRLLGEERQRRPVLRVVRVRAREVDLPAPLPAGTVDLALPDAAVHAEGSDPQRGWAAVAVHLAALAPPPRPPWMAGAIAAGLGVALIVAPGLRRHPVGSLVPPSVAPPRPAPAPAVPRVVPAVDPTRPAPPRTPRATTCQLTPSDRVDDMDRIRSVRCQCPGQPAGAPIKVLVEDSHTPAAIFEEHYQKRLRQMPELRCP